MDSDRCFIGYRRMEEEELSLPEMRQMCDVYVRTLYPGSFGGSNTYLADEALYAFRDIPELALNAFNSAKGRNFKLVKFIKLNRINTLLNSMTFEAKEDGSDECLLFRAVVNLIGTDNVLLCEIRDDDENKDLGDDILSSVWHHITTFALNMNVANATLLMVHLVANATMLLVQVVVNVYVSFVLLIKIKE